MTHAKRSVLFKGGNLGMLAHQGACFLGKSVAAVAWQRCNGNIFLPGCVVSREVPVTEGPKCKCKLLPVQED
eukprot:1155599-Pelagomonas_calceolata.AAC.9